jgi:ribosomal protein S18 acetylase RimI-like enzyme
VTPPPIAIRPYRPEDREALVGLWSEVFPNDPLRNPPDAMIDNKQRVQPELLLVAVHEVRLIGAVMAGFDGTRGWIHHLAVHPTHRLRGVGTELVQAAEAGLRDLGCPKVNLQIRVENSGVLAFYEALGFAVEERVSMGKVLGTPASTSDVTLT